MKFCSNCGTQLTDDIRFCPNCGQEAPAPQADVAATPQADAVAPAPQPTQPYPQADAVAPTPQPTQPYPQADAAAAAPQPTQPYPQAAPVAAAPQPTQPYPQAAPTAAPAPAAYAQPAAPVQPAYTQPAQPAYPMPTQAAYAAPKKPLYKQPLIWVIAVLFVALVVVTLMLLGVFGGDKTPTVDPGTGGSVTLPLPTPQNPDPVTPTPQPEPQPQPQTPTPSAGIVLADRDGVRVTVSGDILADDYGISVPITVENTINEDIVVMSLDTYANRGLVDASLWLDVAASSTATGELWISPISLEEIGIDDPAEVGQVELRLNAFYDSDYSDIYVTEPIELTIPGSDWDGSLSVPDGVVIFDEYGITGYYCGSYVDSVDDLCFDFYFTNESNTNITIESAAFRINGNDTDAWIYVDVRAGYGADDFTWIQSGDFDPSTLSDAFIEIEFMFYDYDSYELINESYTISFML